MAQDPAFLFYPGDYLRDTQCLSEPAQVAYDRIMCEHMRNIPISQARLDFFTKRLTPAAREDLLSVLRVVSGGYQIEWVAESLQKRRDYSDSRRKNRSGTKKDMSIISKHMENENEIVNENDLGKRVQGENPLPPAGISRETLEHELATAFDEITLENYSLQFQGIDLKEALAEFRLKVRNASANYIGHGVPGLRSAFQHHLRGLKSRSPDKSVGQKSKSEIMEQVRKIQSK